MSSNKYKCEPTSCASECYTRALCSPTHVPKTTGVCVRARTRRALIDCRDCCPTVHRLFYHLETAEAEKTSAPVVFTTARGYFSAASGPPRVPDDRTTTDPRLAALIHHSFWNRIVIQRCVLGSRNNGCYVAASCVCKSNAPQCFVATARTS